MESSAFCPLVPNVAADCGICTCLPPSALRTSVSVIIVAELDS